MRPKTPIFDSSPEKYLLLVYVRWALLLSCLLDCEFLPLDSLLLLLLIEIPLIFPVVGVVALYPPVYPPCATLILCIYDIFILPSILFFFLNVRRLVRTRLSQILLQICLKTVKVKVWAYLSFYLRYIIRI